MTGHSEIDLAAGETVSLRIADYASNDQPTLEILTSHLAKLCPLHLSPIVGWRKVPKKLE